MKYYLLLVLVCSVLVPSCVKKENSSAYVDEIRDLRYAMNVKFANKETTVLSTENFEDFSSLDFYPVDSTYRISAKFTRTPDETPILFPTTTGRKQVMLKYGEANFELNEKVLKLNVYQTEGLGDEHINYLFIPFMDTTNGNETYGGGRYIDTRAPKNDQIIIDFNKAYNPYCAYNDEYSCVIPPRENRLAIAVKAGIKNYRTSGYKK